MHTCLTIALGLCLVTTSAQADNRLVRQHAEVGRLVDFSGGLVTGQSEVGATELGAELSARYHDARGFYIGGLFSTGLLVDSSNVERVDLALLAGAGLSLGLHARIGALQIHSGVRGEYLAVADGNGMAVPNDRALRAGPEFAMALAMGHLWGHPMSLEARAGYLFYSEGEGRFDGARAGLFLTGGLFPEP